ncbi:MAG: hypothetical protein RLZ12_54 [Bacillota bacterium]|jgi:aspartate-semialdehyde dehydrogenase
MRIGIVGATGNVGRKVVKILLERGLVGPNDISLFASSRSAGSVLRINDTDFTVFDAKELAKQKCDLFIFNTEEDVSGELVPRALQTGAYVVDSSSCYRLKDDVPLIVPPVNSDLITTGLRLYAHANCLTSPIATVIAPLHWHRPLSRVQVVTYQSVSGAGKAAMDECFMETKAKINAAPYERSIFNKQIAFNIIPQVGKIREDGFTYEEYKIINELKKVVDQKLHITATAVRVPVLIGHAVAISLEWTEKIDLEQDLLQILEQAPFVKVSSSGNYLTPAEITGKDDVFVGRIRRDPSVLNGVQMWICSDNLRRGAATDAVEISTALLKFI